MQNFFEVQGATFTFDVKPRRISYICNKEKTPVICGHKADSLRVEEKMLQRLHKIPEVNIDDRSLLGLDIYTGGNMCHTLFAVGIIGCVINWVLRSTHETHSWLKETHEQVLAITSYGHIGK